MNQKIYFALGAVGLLAVGISFGAFINRGSSSVPPVSVTPTPTVVTSTPTPAVTTGKIGGFLIYPGPKVPETVGVCAQDVNNLTLITCVKQTKDPKYETGVGYQMELSPGTYYVYATYQKLTAYYDEFVTCGLNYSCKSHAKIPVVVTPGSDQENILPHDWYDATPTAKPTVILKINPNILKLAPTNTPSLTKLKTNPQIIQQTNQ